MEAKNICRHIAHAMGEPESPHPPDYFGDYVAQMRFLRWGRQVSSALEWDDEGTRLYEDLKNSDGEVIALVAFLEIHDWEYWTSLRAGMPMPSRCSS